MVRWGRRDWFGVFDMGMERPCSVVEWERTFSIPKYWMPILEHYRCIKAMSCQRDLHGDFAAATATIIVYYIEAKSFQLD